MKHKALGKGLGALIPERKAIPEDHVQNIPLGQIKPTPFQPRKEFNPESLSELAESIKEKGVILPIVVRPVATGFELVAGERRWRAAKLAGLDRIPAIVKTLSDISALETALIENLQREDLDPLEAANGYRMLQEEYQLTQEEVAQKIGKDRATIANALRLLKLPPEIQHFIQTQELTTGHAKVLLGVKSPDLIIQLGTQAAKQQWSVRMLESKVKQLSREASLPKNPPPLDPVIESILDSLKRRFSTKITFKPNKNGTGSITLDYYSSDDLARILEILNGD